MFNNGNGGYSLADIAAVTDNRNNGGLFGGGYGDGSWWVILFFLLAFGGFGGNGWFGGWGNGNSGVNGAAFQGALTRGDLTQEFDFQNLRDSVTNLGNQISSANTSMLTAFDGVIDTLHQGFDSNNISMLNATNSIQQSLNDMNVANIQSANAMNIANIQSQNALQAQLANNSCENREAIAQVRYDMATDACAINTNNATNTRDIIENQNANTRAILDSLQANRIEALQEKIATLTSQNQGLQLAASQAAQNQYLIDELRPSPAPAYVVPNPYTGYGYPYGMGGCCGCNA